MDFTLKTTTTRTETGTAASRRLRRENMVPAIIYGNDREPVKIAIDHDELIHSVENEEFFDATITLNLEGGSEKVQIQDLQRHPFKHKLMHADFLRI